MNVHKTILLASLFVSCQSFQAAEPLAPEKTGLSLTLPAKYPGHWVIAHDASFFHMSDGKFVVLDPLEDRQPEQFKGMFNGANIAAFAQAGSRPEMYVAETFYSRGNRGERTDVLTIYDTASLSPIDEVILPGGKRSSHMPQKHALQLIDHERFALVYNFTPASSVTVVNLVSREVVNEVPIPGCALIYPTGKRGFSSWCNDGTMMSVQLDEQGAVTSTSRTGQVFDPVKNPFFEKPAIHGNMAWFPSFAGEIQAMDLSGAGASPGERWWLTGPEEREAGWRPGGWQFVDADAQGRLYILMHPSGAEGSHKDPGTEVWVYDPETRERIRRIELRTPGISLMVTATEQPAMLVTSIEMGVDVYDPEKAAYLRTLSFAQETPFVIHRIR